MKIYDSDIRSLLFQSFLEIDDYIGCEDTIVINELDVCSGISRADIVVINGKMHGYEIKSSQDNLSRLSQQMQSYNRIFDTMKIVASESHIQHIIDLVPDWWGLLCATKCQGEIKLETIRAGLRNESVDYKSVASLLWRDEMLELLATHTGTLKGYKSKSRFDLSGIIADIIDTTIIEDYVRSSLKARSTWRAVRLQQLGDDLHRM